MPALALVSSRTHPHSETGHSCWRRPAIPYGVISVPPLKRETRLKVTLRPLGVMPARRHVVSCQVGLWVERGMGAMWKDSGLGKGGREGCP